MKRNTCLLISNRQGTLPAISGKKAKLTGTNQGSEVPGMIFKICSKEELPKLLDTLAANHKERPFDLAATLSIRNTDLKQKITLISVDYFDSNGNLLKNYVPPLKLNKLATIRYVIKSSDKSGGSGAKFIVRWESTEPVNPTLIEAIMISTKSQQGISFISRGQAIKE